MNSHENTLKILGYIEDSNLNLLYKDSVRDEAFERVSKLRNLNSKVRDKLISLYPELRKQFSIIQIKALKDSFYLSNNKKLAVSSFKSLIFSLFPILQPHLILQLPNLN